MTAIKHDYFIFSLFVINKFISTNFKFALMALILIYILGNLISSTEFLISIILKDADLV